MCELAECKLHFGEFFFIHTSRMVVQNCHSVVLKQKHLVRECGYQQLVIAEGL